MARLIVIRHAQASLLKDDYDQISDLGAEQSEMLGNFLAKQHPKIDHIFRGSLKRHDQTASIIMEQMSNHGLVLPDAKVLPEWNEHDGQKMGKYFIPRLMHVDPIMKKFAAQLGDDQIANKRLFLRIFHRLTELWAAGEVNTEEAGAESWTAFQSRIQQGMEMVSSGLKPKTTSLLVTSGGSISVLMGEVLGLSSSQVLDLSWIVKNTSISEFHLEQGKLQMRSFNEIGHLSAEQITFV